MAWGKTPTTTTEGPLTTNQVFISSVAVPNHANGDLTALEGGPASTDGNGNETAPASMYVKDGGNVTQGSINDAAVTSDTPGSVSAKLRGLVKMIASAWDSVHGRLIVDGSQVTQPVSGTVTETNSSSINTHLANIDSDSASLVTNTTGLATQATLSAAKADLDTIVTNTNKIPASPAQEGGNLATIAGAISAGKMQTTVTNANANGQSTMVNSSPVAIASDQSPVNSGLKNSGGIVIAAREPDTFKTFHMSGVGANNVWTPASGKTVRLMRYIIFVSADASLLAAGELQLTWYDNTASLNLIHYPYLPSAAGTTMGQGWTTGWIDLGNEGIVLSAANDILKLNVGTGLATGHITGIVAGQEN